MTHTKFLRQHNKVWPPLFSPLRCFPCKPICLCQTPISPKHIYQLVRAFLNASNLPRTSSKCQFTRMRSIFPYPRSDTVLPGGFSEPSPGHAAIGTGEPQFHFSPVGSGQKLEPKTVRLRQAAVHPGQPSPGTASRRRGGREGAAPFSVHVHIPQVWVILQGNWLTAWREPVPLGQHGIARSEVVRPNGRIDEISSQKCSGFCLLDSLLQASG